MTKDIKRILKWALEGLIFGVLTGYFGEFVSHHMAGLPYSGIDDPWYWWVIIPSSPGDTLVFGVYNLSDSYLDDEWDYRVSVSVFNGLFWMLFGLILDMLYALSKHFYNKLRRRLIPKQAT